MKIDETLISEIEKISSTDTAALQSLGNVLLEDGYVKAGMTVAVVGDPTYPFDGQRGKVKGPSNKSSGLVDVEFANGNIVPLQSSLLVPV